MIHSHPPTHASADGVSENRSRRAILQNGTLLLLAAGIGIKNAADLFAEDAPRTARIGLMTDMHYADKPAAGSRYYRESIAKLEEAAAHLSEAKPDAVVELGDFIDAADSVDKEKSYLKKINALFQSMPGEKHYVLGNHCVHTLKKPEFLEGVEKESSSYSFDLAGVHCVVLDSCFNSQGDAYGRGNFHWTDANIPDEQIEWLAADLKAAKSPVVVFAHQRLDGSDKYCVKNAVAVRETFKASGKVAAVFQGHSHKNEHKLIDDVHYCTLAAMIEGSGEENNAYAVMDVLAGGAIRIQGFRKQSNYNWT